MKKPKNQQEKDKETIRSSPAKLLKEVAKAEGIISAVGDGLTVLDKTFKVIYQNQAHKDMMGVHVGEFCYKAYVKKQGICGGCPVSLTFKDGKVHVMQRERNTDKGIRYVEITASPLKDSEGEIFAGIEIVRDITERKQVEEALRVSEQHYRNIYNTAPLAFVLWDRETRVTDWNNRAEQMLGWTHEEIVGQNFFDYIIPEAARIHVHEIVKLLLEGKLPSYSINENITKSGQIILCEWNNSIIKDSSGNVVGVISLGLDISERKRAEDNLRESEKRFKNIFHNASDGILLADPETKTYYLGNRTICHKLGYSEEEIKNLGIQDIHPKEALQYVIEQFEKQMRREIELAKDIPVKRKDGSIFYADINSFPLTIAGKQYITRIFRDITERKQDEEKAQQRENLLRETQKIAHLGSWELDLTTNCLTWTDEVYHIFGIQPQEFAATYEAFIEQVHPDDRDSVDAAYSSSVRDGRDSYEIEHRIVKQNTGEIRYVHEKCIHIKTATGKIIRSIGMVHDITDRKHTEQELAIFKQFAEASSLAYGFADLNGDIMYINPTLCRLLEEEKPQDAIGKNVEVYYPETEKVKLLNEVLPSVTRKGDWFGEIPLQSIKGKVTPTIQNISLIRDDKGNPLFIGNIIVDITERKKAEEVLKKSEEKLRNIIEHSNELYYAHDTNQVLSYVSPQSKQILGYTQEEMKIEWTKLVTDSPINEKGIEITEKAIQTGEKQGIYLLELYRKDKSKVLLEIDESPLKDEQGKVIGMVGAARDVTESIKAEEALKISEQEKRMLLDSTAEAIYGIDLQGNCTFVNQACLILLGYDNEKEILGQNMHNLIHAKYPDGSVYPAEKCKIYKVFQAGEKINVDNEVFWKADGTSFPVEYWSYPIEQKGKVIGAVITFLDISERRLAEEMENKRTEQKLLNKEALLHLMQKKPESLEELSKYITLMSAQILAVERVSIWFFDKQRSEIVCQALYLLSKHEYEKGLRLKTKNYPQHFVAFEESQVLAVENALTDPRTNEMSEDYLKPYGIISKMDVPIRRHGELIGIICHEQLESRQWLYEEQEFAISLSHIITINLENIDRTKTEEELKKNQGELQKRVKDLEDFYSMAVSRELRMIDLKNEITELKEELEKYKKQ